MTAATSLQPITQSMDGVTIAPTTQIEPNGKERDIGCSGGVEGRV